MWLQESTLKPDTKNGKRTASKSVEKKKENSSRKPIPLRSKSLAKRRNLLNESREQAKIQSQSREPKLQTQKNKANIQVTTSIVSNYLDP